eukprot:TRINITY_DN11037_c0_g5_i1.p1 TRINITY_DN11037_c0_g5~~TRINITY_DN11037_c0_g5_i1.p1  ORF type:complete len:897 (-),score=225.35 TRINITY_DN11037_c0_g5_i1:34-2724(-)
MPPKKGAPVPEEEPAPPEEIDAGLKFKLPVDVIAQDPRSLKYLLESPEIPIVLASVKALCKYADTSAEARVELKDIGCISALMALYGSKSVELQIAVTEVLERIAKEEVNRAELTERGALAQFLDLLVGKNQELRSVAATAMQWMSEDATTRQAVYRAHELAVACRHDIEFDKAATLERGPSPPKQRGLPAPPSSPPPSPIKHRFSKARDVTKNLENLERCTVGLLGLPKKPKDRPDIEMINKGLCCLGNFADDCIARHELCDLTAINILLSMLPLDFDDRTPEDDEAFDLLKERAASSLTKIASELTLRPLMRTTPEMKDFGCVGPLAKLLDSSTNPSVRAACAAALANLALDGQSRLDMLQVYWKQEVYGAAPDHTLYGAVKALILRTHDGDECEKAPCLQALARISSQPIGCDAIINGGMLGYVAEMLSTDRIEAAAAAATEDICVRLLKDATCIVANCLTRPLPAENDAVRDQFAETGGLSGLVDLAKSVGMQQHPKLLSTALYCVMQLVQTATCRRQVIEQDLVAEMVRLLADESKDIKMAAAYTMATLAYDNPAREQLIQKGVLELIMLRLEDPSLQVQAAALFCVSNAVRSAAVRTKVVDQMGLGRHLVRILECSDSDVLKNALRCTCAIATDVKNAVQLCFDGVLQKAEYHQTSQSKAVRKYATETLMRILNSNLPAKLWLAGTLGDQDRVEAQFYDVGKTEQWLSLQQLQATEPNNYKAEVLVWDLQSDTRAQRWVQDAKAGVADCTSEILEQVGFLAKFVSKQLGGAMMPVDYFNNYDVGKFMRKAKRQSKSQCVPLGQLTNGGTRHRALLLKILCDCCDLDCSLERGPFKRGAHAFHSWNVVTTENQQKFVVDLVFAPGAVYAEGSEEARQYQCRDEYAFSSLCQ